MTIRVALKHHTRYTYDRAVKLYPHTIRLRPAPHSRTPIPSYSIKVEPAEHFVNWQQDPFGNYLARYVFPEKTRTFSISVELIADLVAINPFDFFLEEHAERFPFAYGEQLTRDLTPYLEIRENGPLLKDWLARVDRTDGQHIVSFLVGLNQRLQQDVGYLVRMEPGVQSCEETLSRASGSCRDSAWLMVQICRHLGLAARFVSGYLVQLVEDVKPLDGPAGPEADFTDLHAWAEVYLPGAGWIGFDPTSGLLAGEGHIPLACTPDPAGAAPVTGSTDVAEVSFEFENRVERIREDPRVTKPYGDAQWSSIVALGERIEAELEREDVRLTMGGEPTFVSIDDMEGEEWNHTAMSEKKLALATDLLLELKTRFAPKGVVHFGQGKWYPGEPLPRWALSLFWRTDGEAIVAADEWIDSNQHAHGFDTGDAGRFVAALAKALEVAEDYVVPGYEDTLYHLWKESTLPENVTPEDSKLRDPMERKRLRERFVQGLDAPTGYALPIKWRELTRGDGEWVSSPWPFRDGYMFLLPGDSPVGYRLPLASLPWEAPDPTEFEPERDPFEPQDDLPPADAATAKKKKRKRQATAMPTGRTIEIVHTALCVEARNGRLHVFLPPQEQLEVYLDLVNQVAKVARDLELPVVLEGYEPPRDPRLKIIQVTPDPGVIEVNIHPADAWSDLQQNTETLYEAARVCRLGTEKFMLDGRHSGTGGGNHVTLGAATPADSPFLRRPDLLRSLLSYWQRHPSLSYLFSGLFIGPTSQAPRVDEARDDNLYELEIALSLLPEGENDRPWIVDRLLRNFLVDLTGNTHRAEFCIDKLYSPSGPAGRKGLVEFRAFEMPPHARMSLVQMLLLRCLVARFWKTPYKAPLIRWGTELHDRFMLRHFVWEDFREVIRDLRDSGYPFEVEWFAPFLEFRFPHVGSINAQEMQLDLHTALEPWHVLGEESGAQGTARYVDSSVERLQVSVHGVPGDRYLVTCNGRKLPLKPTGIRGSFVAGVRYKAWAPPSSLHPTIDVHTPLVFDIVDTANRRSVAGCTYHVSHPGGRNYDTFPMNAREAEARRLARFLDHGGSQGEMRIVPETPHPEHPFTLDLRTALS
ncbi:MAG: DUF2126 domain-containing protein [Pseudomonadales bacterium]